MEVISGIRHLVFYPLSRLSLTTKLNKEFQGWFRTMKADSGTRKLLCHVENLKTGPRKRRIPFQLTHRQIDRLMEGQTLQCSSSEVAGWLSSVNNRTTKMQKAQQAISLRTLFFSLKQQMNFLLHLQPEYWWTDPVWLTNNRHQLSYRDTRQKPCLVKWHWHQSCFSDGSLPQLVGGFSLKASKQPCS